MSSRTDMLLAAARSLSPRGDTASLVARYLRSQLAADGGFCDRSGNSDLYYTVFGLEALVATGEPVPPGIIPYLHAFGRGEHLDLVHMCCLIRARASADIPFEGEGAAALAARLQEFRAADGGYDSEAGSTSGSAYGSFLVTAAYEDLGIPAPPNDGVLRCLERLRAEDGGFSNIAGQPVGLTPTTAAVATVMRARGASIPEGLGTWLLDRHLAEGGFCAVPGAPFADLLSTATALHALWCLGTPIDPIVESCLAFVQSQWTGDGAFGGSWVDPTPDCEYTYYGLVALGHLCGGTTVNEAAPA